MRPIWFVLPILGLAACAQFDPSRPIRVETDPSWSDTERQALVEAANCWNLKFGTQISFDDDDVATDQIAHFEFNPLACWGALGRFTPGQIAQVDVCPIADWQDTSYPMPVRLFTVLDHEVGRVASIEDESYESVSNMVMGANRLAVLAFDNSPVRAFATEDATLLHDASPDFKFKPQCDEVFLVHDDVTGARCSCND